MPFTLENLNKGILQAVADSMKRTSLPTLTNLASTVWALFVPAVWCPQPRVITNYIVRRFSEPLGKTLECALPQSLHFPISDGDTRVGKSQGKTPEDEAVGRDSLLQAVTGRGVLEDRFQFILLWKGSSRYLVVP